MLLEAECICVCVRVCVCVCVCSCPVISSCQSTVADGEFCFFYIMSVSVCCGIQLSVVPYSVSSLRTQLDDVVANVARLNDQSAHHGGRRCFLSHTGDSDVVDIVSPPRHIYHVTLVTSMM